MYSTKLVNKNMVDGNAYITVGDSYKDRNLNPFRAPQKGDRDLQPFHSRRKPQNAENGNFSKLTYVNDSYKETNKYINTQPIDSRKLGFGTKDAHRRDEFTNTIRTEQYRETLRKEHDLTSEPTEVIEGRLTTLLSERDAFNATKSVNTSQSLFRTKMNKRTFQYDIGRSRVTEFDPRSSKDTYYRFDSAYDKTYGELNRPVSTEVGDAAWSVTYKPPQYGGRGEVKNFFDKSHLNVGSAL